MRSDVQLTHRMLEVFAAVIVHAGVSAAARALNISQPSVSRSISDMETATGLLLFLKRGRSVAPTTQAIALFTQIERSFIGIREISQHAQQLRQQQKGRLSMGCLPALGSSIMPSAIASLRKLIPETTVNLQIESSLSIAQMVATMQIDIGFVAAGSYPSGVQKIDQFSGFCRCILPAHHKLGQLRVISLDALGDEPFIALSSHSRIRQQLENLAPEAIARLSVIAEMKQSSSASELVLRNVGVSVVDPFIAAEHVRRGGTSVALTLQVPYDIDVIAHSDSRPSEAARMLIKEMHNLHKATIL